MRFSAEKRQKLSLTGALPCSTSLAELTEFLQTLDDFMEREGKERKARVERIHEEGRGICYQRKEKKLGAYITATHRGCINHQTAL